MTRYLLLMLSCSIILFFCFIFRVEESHTGNIIIDKSKTILGFPGLQHTRYLKSSTLVRQFCSMPEESLSKEGIYWEL